MFLAWYVRCRHRYWLPSNRCLVRDSSRLAQEGPQMFQSSGRDLATSTTDWMDELEFSQRRRGCGLGVGNVDRIAKGRGDLQQRAHPPKASTKFHSREDIETKKCARYDGRFQSQQDLSKHAPLAVQWLIIPPLYLLQTLEALGTRDQVRWYALCGKDGHRIGRGAVVFMDGNCGFQRRRAGFNRKCVEQYVGEGEGEQYLPGSIERKRRTRKERKRIGERRSLITTTSNLHSNVLRCYYSVPPRPMRPALAADATNLLM
ncbi:hypothetical protein AXG93_4343s1320 [Marchantia polymorpha subsp. ruderalis]|uniref:Uncharacterized protein n=1 Tax=Marchantia polymorpha subsp. ruderalis TaxID=1480154 RepID=A0A176VW42_MARPO|nr:hypothetical protein AXG93_4343s1320 [Marchantia polymorpha subsp. ruderalis]